jgi:hypothetical protein
LYFLWQLFGTNPPPRGVMIIHGSAFAALRILLIGLALSVPTLKYLVFRVCAISDCGVASLNCG